MGGTGLAVGVTRDEPLTNSCGPQAMTTSLRAVVRDHARRVRTEVIVWHKNVAATPRRAGESERKGDEKESVSGLVAVATLLKHTHPSAYLSEALRPRRDLKRIPSHLLFFRFPPRGAVWRRRSYATRSPLFELGAR